MLLWVLLGALLGPLTLLFLAFGPPAYCRNCGSPTRGLDFVCWWCHEDVRVRPASVRAIDARMSSQRVPSASDHELPAARPTVRSAGPALAAVRPNMSADQQPGNGGRRRGSRTRTLAERTDLGQIAAKGSEKSGVEIKAPASARVEEPTRPASIFIPTDRAPARADSPGARTEHSPGSNTAAAGLADESPRVLASAVFVAGSARMTPGHRYGLALQADRFLVLGPTDDDPDAVALDRPIAGLDVRALEGRLIVSEPENRSGVVLAFMAIAGPSTTDLAATISAAASAARERRA